jgi:hypothetical protein
MNNLTKMAVPCIPCPESGSCLDNSPSGFGVAFGINPTSATRDQSTLCWPWTSGDLVSSQEGLSRVNQPHRSKQQVNLYKIPILPTFGSPRRRLLSTFFFTTILFERDHLLLTASYKLGLSRRIDSG